MADHAAQGVECVTVMKRPPIAASELYIKYECAV